jgi:Leucine-rich repeat (LRR) protein
MLWVAGGALPASDPTDWISELSGKIKRDQTGNVVSVDLRGSWIYDSQMIELARLPRLEQLDLSHTRISDEGMLYLKTAPAIPDLNLYYTEQITDLGIHAIKDWKHLKRLNLRGTRISDGALEVISHLSQLEALDIANTQITDNGLDSLMTLINLKELSVGRRLESNNEIELLRLLPTLTYLDLSGPTGAERPDTTYRKGHASGPMRADLVGAIVELKDLRVLRLGYSNVDADGLKTLSVLSQVERLGLEACARVDDEAAAELSNWKSLKYVDLQETKVTQKGVEALRKAKPGIAILGPATAVKTSAGSRIEPGR